MKEKKFCDILVKLRKEQGLTQQELADKLNITEEAVSNWEKGLSYPDIASISSLASSLGVDSMYLMKLCTNNQLSRKENVKNIINTICIDVGLATGVAVIVLNILDEIQVYDSISLIGIGLFCISLSLISKNKKQSKIKTLKK